MVRVVADLPHIKRFSARAVLNQKFRNLVVHLIRQMYICLIILVVHLIRQMPASTGQTQPVIKMVADVLPPLSTSTQHNVLIFAQY